MEDVRLEDLAAEDLSDGHTTGRVEAPDPRLDLRAEFRASQILYQDLKSARTLEAVEALRAEFASLLPKFVSTDYADELRRHGEFAFAQAHA